MGQDWLGAAANQIESLLQVPLSPLSGSDQAIGALGIKRERPSWTTDPYGLHPTNLASGIPPVAHWVPPSVSFNRPQYGEKSPGHRENYVA